VAVRIRLRRLKVPRRPKIRNKGICDLIGADDGHADPQPNDGYSRACDCTALFGWECRTMAAARQLGSALDSSYELVAPEHYGCDSSGPQSGVHAFILADEAARTINIIDRASCTVHLVGHSYGGGVALHAAVERPHRIASLTLYLSPSESDRRPRRCRARRDPCDCYENRRSGMHGRVRWRG
jgi:pimeloyl-ACP methyl ester carboxylesterase